MMQVLKLYSSMLLLEVFCILAVASARPGLDPLFYGEQDNATTTTATSEQVNSPTSPHTSQSVIEARPAATNDDVGLHRFREFVATNTPCPTQCHCYANIIAHCSNANLESFPADVTNRHDGELGPYTNVFPTTTQQMYLGFNSLQEIPPRALSQSGRSLMTLILSNNVISVIHRDAFEGLHRLKHLDLRHNRIRTIVHIDTNNNESRRSRRESVFESLGNSLVSLKLSHNDMRSVPNRAFIRFQSLEILSLSHNRISWIGCRAFEGLTRLKALYLRSNPLNSATISRMTTILEWFSAGENRSHDEDFSYAYQCPAEETGDGTISWRRKKRQAASRRGAGSGRRLNKRQAVQETLKTLDLGDVGLAGIPEGLPSTVQVLMLDGNKISTIAPSALRNSGRLETLHLARNKLRSLPVGAFRYSYNLLLLDLSDNHLNDISSHAFCGLPNLEILRLYKNRELTRLPVKIFSYAGSLKALYLQDCGLSTLPPGPWLYRLTALWLYGNPLSCDCVTIAPLVSNMRYAKRVGGQKLKLDPYRQHILDDGDTWKDQRPSSTTCTSPPTLRGYAVKHIGLHHISCTPNQWRAIFVNRKLASVASYHDYQADGSFHYDSNSNTNNIKRGAVTQEEQTGQHATSSSYSTIEPKDQTEYRRSVLDVSAPPAGEKIVGLGGSQEDDVDTQTRWVIEIPLSSAPSSPDKSICPEENKDDLYEDVDSSGDQLPTINDVTNSVVDDDYSKYDSQLDETEPELAESSGNRQSSASLEEDINSILSDSDALLLQLLLYNIDIYTERDLYYYGYDNGGTLYDTSIDYYGNTDYDDRGSLFGDTDNV